MTVGLKCLYDLPVNRGWFRKQAQDAQELRILMYNTPYTLVLKKDQWENAPGNQMSMTQGLINAVAEAAAVTP